ncbi:MAG: VapC toxin family PIN domain ribonuclease [Deltaproteobacteria bacterium]|nr:MAG: VapC toxin family PIN domain ribonuclease [Deltaproteobacteria bacterium]
MILVDTSVLIDFFKGIQNDPSLSLKEIIRQQIPFGIASVVYQELLQGAKNKKEYKILDEYLSCQRFFHPLDSVGSYGKAAWIYLSCRKHGITVRSSIDCLIAQIAIEHDLLLLHNDKDFINMAPLVNLKLY